MSDTPNGRVAQSRLISPISDEAAALNNLSLRSKTTQELVTLSIENTVAAIRSGEVLKVSSGRVLRQGPSYTPTVASSVKDLVPKTVSRGPVQRVLYF